MRLHLSAVPWKKHLKTAGLYLWKRLSLPVVPLLMVYFLEALQRSNFHSAYEWMREYPDEFIFNYWIAAFLTLLIVGIVGRTRAAYGILLGLAAAAGMASGVAMNRTGLPLLPWKLLLPGSEPDPVASLNPVFSRHLLLVAAAAAAVLLLSLLPRNVKMKWPERALFCGAALFFLFSAYTNFPVAFWDDYSITTVHYEQEYNYNRNGFLVSTLDNLKFIVPVHPAGAGDKDIRKLVRSMPSVTGAADSVPPGQGATREHPNVVVLLSESFWDPTLLPKASFSEDPIPFFHSMMNTTTSGWMLSPQFSGTTANVEFEVLTGNSVRFLPKDAIAYISYMNRGVDSLAGIFSRQGYTATAINPYFNWFFNSRNVYRNMGFSRFVSCEYFEPVFHGPNYEDSQVMEKIIEAADSTPGPDFIFANTMENHGSYEDKFYSNPIKVSGPFSDKVKNILENYATGEQAFDKAFRTLVEHYRQSGEPTVIMSFGDHLPGLGADYLAYKETGYITGRDDPELMDKVQYTPFVIWDNMNLRPRETLRMNASFLGPYLLKYMDRPGSYYTDYLYGLYQKQPLIPVKAFTKSHPMDESILADYKRLQYDILFGRQSGYEEAGLKGKIVPGHFEMGYGSPKLDHVQLDKDGRLEVDGGRFSSGCKIWLNGRELDTSYDSPGKLTAKPDGASASEGGRWDVQVKLADRKNTVISESPILTVPAPEISPDGP